MEAKNPAPGKPGPVKIKVVTEAYTFRKQGFPRIRKAAITFGITLLLSAALVTATRLVLSQVKPGTAQSQQNQLAARERFELAEKERIEIRDFLPKFEQLRARGFYGPESRLVMVEAIQSIQEQRKLLPITYEFAPQRTVLIDPSLLAPPLELRSTRVTLQMGLLHELDLVNFLRDLKEKGFFSVKHCTLTPLEITTDRGLVPRLAAECTLYWLTIVDATPPPEAPVPVQ